MKDVVQVAERGTARVLTLDRPEFRNAITKGMKSRIIAELESAAADDDVTGVILTGRDPAFCAGLDLNELEVDPDGLLDRSLVERMAAFEKLLIGAINGPAVTGGLEIALACDFLVASERASFRDTHALVGLVPYWGLSVRLPQVVGAQWARRMSAAAEPVDAATAARIGLVTAVVAHDRLIDACADIVARLDVGDRSTSFELLGLYDDLEGRSLDDAAARETEAHLASRQRAASHVAERRQQILGR